MTGSEFGLNSVGLKPKGEIRRNLPLERLIAETTANGGGLITASGAVTVDTGIYTGRSPLDRYIVDEPSSTDNIWWGPVNRKVSESVFDELLGKVLDHYNNSSDGRPTYLFAPVCHLEGGFTAWREAGGAVEKREPKPPKS